MIKVVVWNIVINGGFYIKNCFFGNVSNKEKCGYDILVRKVKKIYFLY